jgi:hypothetical protein
MKNNIRTRTIALLTGGVIAASAISLPTVAHADDSKTYKTGAAVLGAASAYFLLKGKTLPGAIAGAGAYYAYKKGQKADGEDRYGDLYPNDDYAYNPGTTYPDYNDNNPYYGGNTYPDSGNSPYYGSNTYPEYGDTGYGDTYPDSGNDRPYYGSNTYPDFGYSFAPKGATVKGATNRLGTTRSIAKQSGSKLKLK